jgi:Zn-dependent metalloprotease
MTAPLETFHYHVADDETLGAGESSRSLESFGDAQARDAGDAPSPFFNSNEAAARFYLDQILQTDERAAARAVIEPERPERVPGLVVENEQDLRALGTHQVRFAQTYQDIPVFGARAVVELTTARNLVSVTAQLDQVGDVDPVESLSRPEALARVAEYTGVAMPAEAALSGRLNFFKDQNDGSWHLAWLLTELPAEPPTRPLEPAVERGAGADDDSDAGDLFGHGLGPRPIPTSFNYLVDAHDGQILFAYSTVPTALATPARCTGVDENDAEQVFFGQLAGPGGTTCQLSDPLRSVRTFDLQFADIESNPPLPAKPVEAASSNFAATNRAAVSAHVNASRVQDFYKVVLQRDGIDDMGMDLISQVNLTWARRETPPSLKNAFWFRHKMWYGQIMRGGRLVSLSRFLDVIGHELTHGVIETTANLVYATQSGALNESFADCAGVIINNWFTASDPQDVGTWSWEIGAGLRPDGRPLRNFADPTLTGHPKHMDNFRQLPPGELPSDENDQGFVHFNSNIHNKAVHNLLTLTNGADRVFTVPDIAVLTYLGMARLAPLATFSDARQAVVDVAQTYFGGSPDRKDKIEAINQAYQLVGIN